MKASELRIGNLLYSDNVVVTIDGRSIFDFWSYGKEYKPIPLTEEWLLKFERIEWLRHDVDGYFFWFNGEKKYVMFLHSLQNVYFAIETNELKWLDTKTVST